LPFSVYPVWIRFQGQAGSIITSAAVSTLRCGTTYTGWYAGQYPATIYTTATSNACFYSSAATPCTPCNLMSITNCGSFFVFGLVAPPICNARYCTI
jgi:hypothetical protein